MAYKYTVAGYDILMFRDKPTLLSLEMQVTVDVEGPGVAGFRMDGTHYRKPRWKNDSSVLEQAVLEVDRAMESEIGPDHVIYVFPASGQPPAEIEWED